MKEQPARFRPDVEGLRAVAVLAVVGYHAGAHWLPGGYVGVDVFFVLSGFLITGLLLDEVRRTGTLSLPRFYARRARRLLPMSALVLLATVALGRAVLAPLDFSAVSGDVRSAALFGANWHFASGATDYMSDTDKSPVLHYWSLAVEEQFYVLWPLLILAAVGRRSTARPWLSTARRVAVVVAVLSVVSFLLSVMTSVSSGPFAYFGLHTRAWELGAGALLAVSRPWWGRLPPAVSVVCGWVGLSAVVTAAVRFDADTVFPGTAALLPVVGTMLLVVAGSQRTGRWGTTWLLSTPPLTYVGRVSYAWYLWHWPLLIYAAHEFGTAVASEDDVATTPQLAGAAAAATVAVSFVLAAASHWLVEAPVRRSRRLVLSPARSLALGASLTALGVLAAAVGFAAQPLTVEAFGTTARKAQVSSAGQEPQIRLRMTPAAARLDKPAGTGECYNAKPGLSNTPRGCRFGDPRGRRTVVLVGDSQAEQWLPALITYGKAHGWRVFMWAKASCPFNDVPIWSSVYKSEFKACYQWRDKVHDRIEALPRVDLILLSRSRSYNQMAVLPNGRRTTTDNVLPVWRDGTRRTLKRLAGLGAEIGMFHATPVAPVDPPACLSEHLDELTACDFPRVAGTGDMLLAAERSVAATRGASILDLTDDICPTDPCPVVSPTGLIVYRDIHHLTATFSRTLSETLGTRLMPLVE